MRVSGSYKESAFIVGLFVAISWSVPAVGFDVNPGTEYRIRATGLSNYPVDEFGRDIGQNTFGTERLRLSPTLTYDETLKYGGQIDFLSGQNFGQKPVRGTEFAEFPGNVHRDYTRNIDPRHLWVEKLTNIGVVKIGQMGSQWGLGIMANDGEGRDMVWGDAYFGDIVDRILFATKPFLPMSREGIGQKIVLAVGLDLVFRDDLGSLMDGDKAYQGVVSGMYLDDKITGGFYIAYRDQTYDNGDTLQGTGYDVYGRATIPVAAIDGDISLAGEGVILKGTSSRFRTEGGPAGVDILGVGGVMRAGIDLGSLGLSFTAEAGYASGDKNPYDKTFRIFSFDPDYNVGLILYEEVLAGISAVDAELAGNPSIVGYPASGIEKLPTNGAVRNSLYIFPTVSYKPMENVLLNLGFLTAWVDSPFVDQYYSFRAGGVPRTFRDVSPPSPHLGYEIDGSVQYFLELGLLSSLRLVSALQYGYFIPGKAFADAQGDRGPNVQKCQVRLSLLW